MVTASVEAEEGAREGGCNKYGWCERQGFVAVYSSAQTAHSSPADVPASLLLCRIDEPSTQVSSRSLYIDKAIMHAFLLCITVSLLSRQMGCQSDIFPHTSALCCEEDVGSQLFSTGNKKFWSSGEKLMSYILKKHVNPFMREGVGL